MLQTKCYCVLQARAGQTKTVGELQQLIAALQKDKKLLQTQVAQHKAAAQRVEEVRQEALLALTALKVLRVPSPLLSLDNALSCADAGTHCKW